MFIGLVDQIHEKKKSKNPFTKDLEREIDLLVYKLYDLKEEEIDIVEKSVGR